MQTESPSQSDGSQLTAVNQSVKARGGTEFAYRRFGNAGSGNPPLLFLQHFRGNLENWDPLLVDTLSGSREVILLDGAGVGLSSGTTPRNITDMASDAISFTDALELKEIDLLGFSIGGMIAQEVALLRPQLVRRLILAATGPQGGGEQMHGWIPEIVAAACADQPGVGESLRIFFALTETSRAKGVEHLRRMSARQEGRDRPNGLEVRDAQYDAIVEWGIPDLSRLARLAGIRQPTLVANGDNDVMIPTVNSQILGRHLPNARVRIFPDAAHGFLFQWPLEFAATVEQFLA